MTDSPLEVSPDLEARIRARARHLWERDGSPHGRELDYWENARELIAIEDSAGAGQLPNPMTQGASTSGEIVEEASIQDNYGEFPDRLTDQGDRRETPMTRGALRKSGQGTA
jgi:Protein of unknown function (DUF2934)